MVGNKKPLALPAPPPKTPSVSSNAPLALPPKSNENRYKLENEARERLRKMNDEKFALLRQKATLRKNRESLLQKIENAKKSKANYIKTQNNKTRKNANAMYNKNIANMKTKLNSMQNNASIDARIKAIANDPQRTINKNLLRMAGSYV